MNNKMTAKNDPVRLWAKVVRCEPLSLAETAALLGINRSNVQAAENRAKAKIRKALGAVAGRSGV